jgi:hypothetical protein
MPHFYENLYDKTPGNLGFHSWQGRDTFLRCVSRLSSPSSGYQGVKVIIY